MSDSPAVVPPNSMFRTDVDPSCKSPVMDRVPAATAPPGLIVPLLIKPAAPVPTVIVPLADRLLLILSPVGAVRLTVLLVKPVVVVVTPVPLSSVISAPMANAPLSV